MCTIADKKSSQPLVRIFNKQQISPHVYKSLSSEKSKRLKEKSVENKKDSRTVSQENNKLISLERKVVAFGSRGINHISME